MSNAMRAALVSGLLYPGLGQIILKRYRRGLLLMFSVSLCLLAMVVNIVQQLRALLAPLQSAGEPPDAAAIADVLSQASAIASSPAIGFASWALLFGWIFGIVDAYRIGKQRDAEKNQANPSSCCHD